MLGIIHKSTDCVIYINQIIIFIIATKCAEKKTQEKLLTLLLENVDENKVMRNENQLNEAL